MPDSYPMSAASAMETWALSNGIYRHDQARLVAGVPFPATLYTALQGQDVPPSEMVRQLISELQQLASDWQEWEATRPEGADG